MDFLYIISKTLPARNLCSGLRAIAREMTNARQRERPRAPPSEEGFGTRFPESKAAKRIPCPHIGECAAAAADEVAPASAHRARFPEAMAAKRISSPRIGECAGTAVDGVAPFSAHRARFPESMAAKRISSPRIGECAAAAADGVAPFSAQRFLIFSDAFSARSVRQRARSAARWPAL